MTEQLARFMARRKLETLAATYGTTKTPSCQVFVKVADQQALHLMTGRILSTTEKNGIKPITNCGD